jgi:hypothetical protein
MGGPGAPTLGTFEIQEMRPAADHRFAQRLPPFPSLTCPIAPEFMPQSPDAINALMACSRVSSTPPVALIRTHRGGWNICSNFRLTLER